MILALVVSLLIPTAPTVNASEKCLTNFEDSEWSNGTPAGVKSLLGFDLVERITKNPKYLESLQTSFAPLNSYFIFGEYTESLSYNYTGKNCASRDIVVYKLVNEQSVSSKYKTISERIDTESGNFLVKQNSIKFYEEINKYLSTQNFEATNKKPENSSALSISRFVDQEELKYDRKVVSLGSASDWFIYFPSKCGFFMQQATPGQISPFPYAAPLIWAMYRPIEFKANGTCFAELRIGGQYSVSEKIADIKYVVTSAPSATTITCKKGKTIKKVKGTNPKCPSGYKKA
jgi:uncharacterized protein YqkB